MHLLHGNSRVENGNHDGAIRSFKRARAQLRPHTSRALSMISLVSFLVATLQRIEIDLHRCQISGWRFEDLDMMIRQRLCEALHAAGRTDEAGESLLNIVNSVDEGYMREPLATWVPGELRSTCSCATHSKFYRRFLATVSLHSRKRRSTAAL
jgi:hypothetical protein